MEDNSINLPRNVKKIVRPVISVAGSIGSAIGGYVAIKSDMLWLLGVGLWLLLLALTGYLWTTKKPQNLATLKPRKLEAQYPRGRLLSLAILAFYTVTCLWLTVPVYVLRPAENLLFGSTATPLAGNPAAEDEIVVVVAEFEKTSGANYEPHIDMVEVLEEIATEIGNVRVILLEQPVANRKQTQNREQAQKIGEVYNATMVVFGRVTPGGATAHYEIVHRKNAEPAFLTAEAVTGFNLRVSASDVESFEVFIYEGMDSRYITAFVSGHLYYLDHRYEKAVDALTLAEKYLDPERHQELRSQRLYFVRGNAYGMQGKYEHAKQDFDHAVQLDPDDSESYYYRGFAHIGLHQYEAAIVDLNTAIQIDSYNSDFYASRCYALNQLYRYSEAVSDCTRAIEITPSDHMSFRNRAHAFHELGRFNLSLIDLQRVVELNPYAESDYVFLSDRGSLLADMGQYDKALEDLNRAIQISPDFAPAYHNRGTIFFVREEYENALSDWERALELAPDSFRTYCSRGSLYSEIGEFDEAIKDLEIGIDIEPNNAECRMVLGNSYSRQGKYTRALDYYSQALEIDPANVMILYNRALTYGLMGFSQAAITDFTQAIQLDSSFMLAYFGRAGVYFVQGECQLAIKDFDQTIQIDPDYLPAYLGRGLAEYCIEDFEGAVIDLEHYVYLTAHPEPWIIGLLFDLQQITGRPLG